MHLITSVRLLLTPHSQTEPAIATHVVSCCKHPYSCFRARTKYSKNSHHDLRHPPKARPLSRRWPTHHLTFESSAPGETPPLPPRTFVQLLSLVLEESGKPPPRSSPEHPMLYSLTSPRHAPANTAAPLPLRRYRFVFAVLPPIVTECVINGRPHRLNPLG